MNDEAVYRTAPATLGLLIISTLFNKGLAFNFKQNFKLLINFKIMDELLNY